MSTNWWVRQIIYCYGRAVTKSHDVLRIIVNSFSWEMAKTYWRSTKPPSLPWNQRMAPMWGMFRRNSFWASDDVGVTILNLSSCESVSEANEGWEGGTPWVPNNSRDSIYRFMDSLCCAVTCDFFSTTHTRTDGHFRFLYSKVTISVYLTVKKIKNTHRPPFTIHRQLHMAARACGSGRRVSISIHSSAILFQAFDTRNRAIPKHVWDGREVIFTNRIKNFFVKILE